MAKKSNPESEALLVPARCPKCGGELGKTPAGRLECRYCGTSFLPGEVFGGKAVDLQKFYERALAAVEEGDYGRAAEYFERIIETDAAEYQAWVGKGVARAYARLSESQVLEAGEVLSCVDMALERYAGETAAFESQLADRVGALAVDLFARVTKEGANDEKNLRALLDLLAYWEAKGTDELECWLATVAVAEKQAVPPKAKRRPGVTYLTFDYPFRAVAEEYAGKIRAKYDAEFTTAFERRAESKARLLECFKTVGTYLLIGAGVAVVIVVIIFIILIVLGVFGLTYFF
jgi:tetratricopeptide (TPR) repeat protein